MRKQTGLRNRYRSGRGPYSIQGKSSGADRYGTWDRGKRAGGQEVIGGHVMSYDLLEGKK